MDCSTAKRGIDIFASRCEFDAPLAGNTERFTQTINLKEEVLSKKRDVPETEGLSRGSASFHVDVQSWNFHTNQQIRGHIVGNHNPLSIYWYRGASIGLR